MVEFVKTLRERTGEIREYSAFYWKDLPLLADCLSENWNDPLSSRSSRHLTQRKMTEWKNLNSFIIRLTSKSFCPWLQLPIQEIRNALESPLSRGAVMECRIWVATEWIIRRGDVLLHRLTGENVNWRFALSLATGPSCRNVRRLGIERWEYWKHTLQNISNCYRSLALNYAVCLRIEDTFLRMSAFEREKAFLDRGH
ncbi:hypothetical protein F4805DRAFT_404989 [Annulohypoxylon moriforme]|nr:hypothetical protein F4805DRAFT_404989 [Annulohypoxylon moriforme]